MNGSEKAAESPAKDQRTGFGALMSPVIKNLPAKTREACPVGIDDWPSQFAINRSYLAS